MSRKQKIRELETQLRIVGSQLRIIVRNENSGHHSRYNKFYKQYVDILKELELISLKWKIKKFMRRIKRHG